MSDNVTHHFTNRAHQGMTCVYCGRTEAQLREDDPSTEPAHQVCDKISRSISKVAQEAIDRLPEKPFGPRAGVIRVSDINADNGYSLSATDHLDRLDREAN